MDQINSGGVVGWLCAGPGQGIAKLWRSLPWSNAWTIPLEDLNSTHLEQAGSKAVTLGRMQQANLPVPPGFVLTAAAFKRFASAAPGWPDLQAELARLKHTPARNLAALSRRLQSALADQPMPPAVENAIQAALADCPRINRWAVRSSATMEDLPGASFAGQHDSFLNVPGSEVPARARQCWLSLFNERALHYRARRGALQDGAAMSVIVQEFIPAELAGVLFTADPRLTRADGGWRMADSGSGHGQRIVIEGARGWGDRVVSGRVAPDRIVLEKGSLGIVERTAGQGPHGQPMAEAGGGNGTMVLEDQIARQLGQLSQRVETLLRGPLDLEWAVLGGQSYLLQARPMTALRPAKTWADRQVWTNLNTGEVFPDVATPATWSMLQIIITPVFRSVFRLFGADLDKGTTAGLVAGRIYFNVNTALAALKPFWFVARRVPDVAHALGGGQARLYHKAMMMVPAEDLPSLGFRWPKYLLSLPGMLWDWITHSPKGEALAAQIKASADHLAGLDFAAGSTEQLARDLAQCLRDNVQTWDLLHLFTHAAGLPVFHKACRDWLGDPDLALAYRLFAGLGGLPETEFGLALWRLAALAKADPQTETAVLAGDRWADLRVRLDNTQCGRQFLAAWDAFMTEHGHHCRGELELANARWSETPDYILDVVRGYLRVMGQTDLLAQQRRLAQEREALTAQCRQRIKNPVKRWIFSWSLRQVQQLARDREEWKNQAVRHIAAFRRLLLVLGGRLAQRGVLAQTDDIFFLEIDEISAVAMGQAPFPVRDLIAARRQEYEYHRRCSPPPLVIGRFVPASAAAPTPDGQTPPHPLPVSASHPPTGNSNQPSKIEHRKSEGAILRGVPVYPGTVTGPARVILHTADHAQVLPGEILVAPFTDPAWTPYFVCAAGVVIEQGGILSHGSIIAREFGLPAVTNVPRATKAIRTGDFLQVDGRRGVVTVKKTMNEERGTMKDRCWRRFQSLLPRLIQASGAPAWPIGR